MLLRLCEPAIDEQFDLGDAATSRKRAQAIEWCLKSRASGKSFFGAWTDLAAAYAWRGQKAEAAAAVAELLKVRPGFTVEQLGQDGSGYSDNPTFTKEFERIVEGARKAGLPER